MSSTKQTLSEAIAGLSGLISEPQASFDGLIALNAARGSIDALYDAYVRELSQAAQTAPLWDAIATAIGSTSGAAGTLDAPAAAVARENKHVAAFWEDHSPQFQWDFLPIEFLHELYVGWMGKHHHREPLLSRHTFTRRLKVAVGDCDSWSYLRSRPGCLMHELEPLAQRVGWRHDGTDAAIYGFRRAGV